MKGTFIWDTKRSLESQLCHTLPRNVSIKGMNWVVAKNLGTDIVVEVKDRLVVGKVARPFFSEVFMVELFPIECYKLRPTEGMGLLVWFWWPYHTVWVRLCMSYPLWCLQWILDSPASVRIAMMVIRVKKIFPLLFSKQLLSWDYFYWVIWSCRQRWPS